MVSSDGVSTDPDKISVVANCKVPTSVKELRSFLEDFSKIAGPLHNLRSKCLHEMKLKKRLLIPFAKCWTIAQQHAFDKLMHLTNWSMCWQPHQYWDMLIFPSHSLSRLMLVIKVLVPSFLKSCRDMSLVMQAENWGHLSGTWTTVCIVWNYSCWPWNGQWLRSFEATC